MDQIVLYHQAERKKLLELFQRKMKNPYILKIIWGYLRITFFQNHASTVFLQYFVLPLRKKN